MPKEKTRDASEVVPHEWFRRAAEMAVIVVILEIHLTMLGIIYRLAFRKDIEMNTWTDISLRVGIPFITAGVIALIARAYYKQRYKAVYDAAAKKYCEFLGRQIRKAVKVENEKVEIQARSIVAVRDDLRKRLVTLSDLLNSEIDELQRDLELLKESPNDNERRKAIKDTIEVLDEKWPSKSMLIETEIRKLLTELGMEKF